MKKVLPIIVFTIALVLNVVEFMSKKNIKPKDLAEVLNGIVNNI